MDYCRDYEDMTREELIQKVKELEKLMLERAYINLIYRNTFGDYRQYLPN